MRCPICNKGELKEEILIKGFIFKRKEIITFCPICDFSKTKIIKISKDDVETEKERVEHEKEVELQRAINTKETRKFKDTKETTDKKFSQRFKRE